MKPVLPNRQVGCAFALALALLMMGVFRANAGDPAGDNPQDGPVIIALHQTDDALRASYKKDKMMELPRVLLFDGQGRPLLGEVGLRDGLGYRLDRALASDKPLKAPLSLDLVLSEVLDANNKPVLAKDLPPADGYVIDYWATWCGPCRMMARDIERKLEHWDKHVVWLKIESDPEKLPESKKH